MEAGFRPIVYDRWGYGASDPRPGLDIHSFEVDIEDLSALLDHLGLSRATLVGHSDGGTLALYFAAAHPQRVTCLVTIAAHVYVEPKMRAAIWSIRQTYEDDAEFRQRFRRAHGDKYQQVFDNWFYGWVKPENLIWDMRPLLRQITCPVLVIQGSEDEDASPQHARDIAAGIPGAELWLAPGAGHMLPRQAARDFNHRLVEFLSKADQRQLAMDNGPQQSVASRL